MAWKQPGVNEDDWDIDIRNEVIGPRNEIFEVSSDDEDMEDVIEMPEGRSLVKTTEDDSTLHLITNCAGN